MKAAPVLRPERLFYLLALVAKGNMFIGIVIEKLLMRDFEGFEVLYYSRFDCNASYLSKRWSLAAPGDESFHWRFLPFCCNPDTTIRQVFDLSFDIKPIRGPFGISSEEDTLHFAFYNNDFVYLLHCYAVTVVKYVL